jgi:putative transposase
MPHVPASHPFVERLIGTIRREFLDQVLFWHARDLERKLAEFQDRQVLLTISVRSR